MNNFKLADDIALAAESRNDLQLLITKVIQRISASEYSQDQGQVYSQMKKPLEMKIEEEHLKQTTDFIYMGKKVSELATSDTDIDRRTGLAARVAWGLTSI